MNYIIRNCSSVYHIIHPVITHRPKAHDKTNITHYQTREQAKITHSHSPPTKVQNSSHEPPTQPTLEAKISPCVSSQSALAFSSMPLVSMNMIFAYFFVGLHLDPTLLESSLRSSTASFLSAMASILSSALAFLSSFSLTSCHLAIFSCFLSSASSFLGLIISSAISLFLLSHQVSLPRHQLLWLS